MSVTPLPTAPSRSDDPDTFVSRADAFVAALPTMVEEINTEFSLSISALNYNATSTTSVTIGTGDKSFTIETGKLLQVGQYVNVTSTASPSNFMFGYVKTYNSGTGALVVTVTTVGGSGTIAAWTISLSPTGAAGADTWLTVQTVSVNGTPFNLDSLNSTATKIALKDAGVVKGYLGNGATGAALFDSAGTARGTATTSGFDVTGGAEATTGLRATGFSAPASGAGVELYYSSSIGNLAAVDRAAATYKPINVRFASNIIFYGVDGNTAKVSFSDTGNQRVRVYGGLPTTASAANVWYDSSLEESFFRSTSAEKYKRDIEDVDPAYSYAFLAKADPKWYRSNTDLCTADNPAHGFWGFSADQVAEFEPRLVDWGYEPEDWDHSFEQVPDEDEPDGFRIVEKRELKPGAEKKPIGFFYDRVSVHHHVIIRDLLAAKEAQAEQIAALESALTALTARLDAIEAT